MNFLIDNLEIIVAVVGGLSIGGIMLGTKHKGSMNDLTPIYIKHKKHTDNINKSSKTIF